MVLIFVYTRRFFHIVFILHPTIKVLYNRKQDVCFLTFLFYLIILPTGNFVYSSAIMSHEWRQFLGSDRKRPLCCWLLNLFGLNSRCLLLLVCPVIPKTINLVGIL